jgi:hypothetical protein
MLTTRRRGQQFTEEYDLIHESSFDEDLFDFLPGTLNQRRGDHASTMAWGEAQQFATPTSCEPGMQSALLAIPEDLFKD